MEQPVSVLVTTVTGDDTLTFRGSGRLTRDARGAHLCYTASGEGGPIASELHLGLGRAVVRTPSYRLLLDPDHPTRAQLDTDGGALPLTVTTHGVRSDLREASGTVSLHYTLVSAGQTVGTFRVTLAVEPLDKERTL